PEKSAFELSDGTVVTYLDLLSDSQRIAHTLTDAGVAVGDRVACQVEKSVRAVAVYLAVLQIGAVALPLNTADSGAELQYFLADAEPAAVVVDPADEAAVREMAPATAVFTLDAQGEGTITTSQKPLSREHSVAPADPAAILYTSG